MAYVMAAPEMMVAASTDLANIGSTLNAANAAAAAPTTQLMAAAGDEVSAGIAALFGAQGQAYQVRSAQAAAFHAQFVQVLDAGAGAYAAAEAANSSPLQTVEQDRLNALNAPTHALTGRPVIGNGTNGAPGTGQAGGPGGILWGSGGTGGTGRNGVGGVGGAAGSPGGRRVEHAVGVALWNGVDELKQPLAPLPGGRSAAATMPQIPTDVNPIALVMGGTWNPVMSQATLTQIRGMYGIANPYALYTPEQLWPLSPQLGNLTLGQSIAQGTQLLNSAIQTQIGHGNSTTIWGVSQSAMVETNELNYLMAHGSPGQGLLTFVLGADPNNPNGGFFERFVGAYVPGLDMAFNGATPPNAPYPVKIYFGQYDFASDFPQYPLNLISDANALAGFFYVHGHSTAHGFVANAIQLPTSPGYTGSTQYFEHLTPNLPLVQPLRNYLPAPYGNALADLLQPDLRVLSDMGYGSGEYANIPTPAQLFELPDPFTILPDLATGTVQGPQAALVDLGVLPPSMYPTTYPFVPVLNPGLNFPTGQPPITVLSLLTGAEGTLMNHLGLIPTWDELTNAG